MFYMKKTVIYINNIYTIYKLTGFNKTVVHLKTTEADSMVWLHFDAYQHAVISGRVVSFVFDSALAT